MHFDFTKKKNKKKKKQFINIRLFRVDEWEKSNSVFSNVTFVVFAFKNSVAEGRFPGRGTGNFIKYLARVVCLTIGGTIKKIRNRILNFQSELNEVIATVPETAVGEGGAVELRAFLSNSGCRKRL